MAKIHQLREILQGDFFSTSDVLRYFRSQRAAYTSLSRLVKRGELISLRRGLYVFSTKHRKRPYSLFQLANLVYGPSYVSCHTMLAFYGMIPERVEEIISVNIKKTRLFKTSLGRFRYRIVPKPSFTYGVLSLKDGEIAFIGATREKALLDTMYFSREKNLFTYAIESLRISEGHLKELSSAELLRISPAYKNRAFEKRVAKFLKEREAL